LESALISLAAGWGLGSFRGDLYELNANKFGSIGLFCPSVSKQAWMASLFASSLRQVDFA
jgi:hypothetical protein